ncbi:MAG: hypothetical protein JWR40_382 [Massilia sp.]|jgi:hypothetical protein|nr:hypothetical protein [Massilia sp.]MDB5951217.1 hypothetical protein [Massilia sp.]
MNRKMRPHPSTAAPRGLINRLQTALKVSTIAGALALVAAPAAMADVITFDDMTPNTFTSGVTLHAPYFNLGLVEGPMAAYFGLVGATGVIANGSDANACDIASCPVGASGNYLGILNDGGLTISLDGSRGVGFTLDRLNFAFLAPFGLFDGSYGQLQLNGTDWSGNAITRSFNLPGQDTHGNFIFDTALLDAAFTSTVLTRITINACVNSDDGCVNSLDFPAMNQAQFALDDISVNVVPEPASGLLFMLGLGALGMTARRRAAAPSTPLVAEGI